jgi:protein-disulfide isomerase
MRKFLLAAMAVVTLGFTQAVMAQDAVLDPAMVADMSIGNPDAKVTVVEYASFTCPHCRNFHETVFGDLKANYIDTGKINFVYREVYFDRFGLWAGMLARCGGAPRYFAISDILYDTQEEWLAGGDVTLVTENLKKMGRKVGMTDEAVDACLNNKPLAEALVAEFQKNSTADEVNSTPTFIINGVKYSNMGYDEFAAILDAELAK